MKNTGFTYHKRKLTKCLLTVALFFSIFSFSGFASNSHSILQQETQTEIVISKILKNSKREISYIKAIELNSCNDFLLIPSKNWTYTLLAYNIHTKVKFDNISLQFCSYKSSTRFFHAKTIPHGSDEDVFLSLVG